MALDGLRSGIFAALSALKGKRKLDEGELSEMVLSIKKSLLEADFNVRQTKEISERLEQRMRDEEPRPGITLQTHALNILYTELVRILGKPREIHPHGQTILMVGLYGQGKTTTTAKLAEWWRRRHGMKVAVIEADSHRPGAYAQLQQLLADTPTTVYGEPDEKDALTIVRNGIAAVGDADLVIIDTAGRDRLDDELQVELKNIHKVANATERFLVIDAQVGQAAGPVAANFHDLVDITGVIVTKLDGTARGGGALSTVATTGAPIVFIGEGEKVGDLELFESDRFISRLLGMGDIQGLIDLAPDDLDAEEAQRIAERLMSGRFSLHDMDQQMEMMSRIGTVDRIMSHMPAGMFGLGGMTPRQKKEMQTNLDRFRVIMDSMTADEKNEPTLLKQERIRRVARGSGSTEKEVRALLAQWNKSRKMMKGMRGDRQMRKKMKEMMGSLDDSEFPM